VYPSWDTLFFMPLTEKQNNSFILYFFD